MPRPPVLPALDWPEIFAEASTFEAWLESAEFPDKAAAMAHNVAEITLVDEAASFLQDLPRRVNVLVIAEDWCGDVVRHVPALMRLARESEQLTVRFVTREERPEVFVRFLTNGGEAIPKFVFFSADFVECGNWGPMPENCRRLIARGKACSDVPAARKIVAARYEADTGCVEAITELLDLVELTSASSM